MKIIRVRFIPHRGKIICISSSSGFKTKSVGWHTFHDSSETNTPSYSRAIYKRPSWKTKSNNSKCFTSSTAQVGGGSFKNKTPIGELGCCEAGMPERSHWWIERWFISLTLSLTIYLPTYLPIYLSIYVSIHRSIYLFISLPVYLWCSVIPCNVV